ncbi:TetR/AcrR family transcriptional regulator [Romeria aff. gracilis LEGE 07310]|uniref:TetR/AcrR family transcriptional regulator n=1 Tax=Vasconcelosia minhoensis LEGE 07310 TaxID=915328 RepID=A0A8J7AAI6_9CYAN|nr:TetR/AcrR family transcriptional regulator [Romeria gracilis]MBE9077201.1 TetR/AcrR family transcriptional regulator [Romeria aff. gracilis LEGE 07310]
MPNQTFFNLPDKKRQLITELAIAEFASYDYDTASISNVVKQAKIAKGSFYQYFEDKKDLYLYLVNLAHQQKIDFLQQARPPKPEIGFFAYLRWLFRESAQFDLSHPALSQIINRAVYGNVPFRDEVLKQIQSASLLYVYRLVEQGVSQGDIDSGIDPDLATFVINTLADGLRYFIPQRLGLNPEQLTSEGAPEIDMQAVEQIFDELIYVLEHGMGSSSITKG